MSPSTYYCWFTERLFRISGFGRRLPKSDRSLPTGFLLVVPALATTAILGLFWTLVTIINLATGKSLSEAGILWGVPDFIWLAIGILAAGASLVHALFSWLVWNQRAARIRASAEISADPIPAPHWALRWTLGLVYFLVISVITPLVLIGSVENLWGAHVWKTTRDALIASGEHLTIDTVIPPPVPAEQNFGSIPLFAAMFDYQSPAPNLSRNLSYSNATKRFNEFQLPHYAVPAHTLPNGRTDPTPASLHEWAEAFRIATGKSTNDTALVAKPDVGILDPVLAKRYGLTVDPAKVKVRKLQKPKELPNYPIAPDGSDDGTVILAGMSIADRDYATLSEASHRLYARFPVHWEDGFATLLPHLAKMKSIQQWTDLRVRARLAKGDVEGAFEDARFALRFADAAREEPLLISQLVRVAQQSIAARSVSHGILSHQWTDAQLKDFQEFFGSWDPIRSFAHAFEGERALGLSMMDQWVSHPSELRNQIDGLGIDNSPESEIPNSFLIASVSHLRFPGIGGLIRQNQATLASYYSLLIRSGQALSKEGEKGGYLPALEAMNKAADETLQTLSSGPNPYNALTRLLAPAVSRAMTKAVRSEQSARLTVTACALERFHRQHGSYPESLSELVPTFVPQPPVDLMDKKPLRYRRNPDGTFTLWSIGLNGVDDGGILHNKTHAEGEALDWVWPN